MLVATEGLEGEEGGSKDTGGGNRTLDTTERAEDGDGRDIRDPHHKLGKVAYNRQHPTSFVIVHTTTPTK